MAKRYLVMNVSIATDKNPNFAGLVHETLNGKGDRLLYSGGSYAEVEHFERKLWESDVREYGYKRVCDAKKCYSYTHPQNDEFWKTEVALVEVEVQE